MGIEKAIVFPVLLEFNNNLTYLERKVFASPFQDDQGKIRFFSSIYSKIQNRRKSKAKIIANLPEVHIGIEPISPESESDVLTITPMNHLQCTRTKVTFWLVGCQSPLDCFFLTFSYFKLCGGRKLWPWQCGVKRE